MYGDTVARLLAIKGTVPTKYWEHNPELQGYKGFTVALSLALKGIVPPI